jgi:hypothetical protein
MHVNLVGDGMERYDCGLIEGWPYCPGVHVEKLMQTTKYLSHHSGQYAEIRNGNSWIEI